MAAEPTGSEIAEAVDHPAHYGGKDNPYEAIKVIENWGLNFHAGQVVKYVSRYEKKHLDDHVTDLKKASWYLLRLIEIEEEKQKKRRTDAV